MSIFKEIQKSKFNVICSYIETGILKRIETYFFFHRPTEIVITPVQYKNFLQAEIRAMKFEEIAQKKATEIRRLQNQVASLKRQLSKPGNLNQTEPETTPDVNVNNVH